MPEKPRWFSGSPGCGSALGTPDPWYGPKFGEVTGHREGAGGGCPPQGSCAGFVLCARHVGFHLCFIKPTRRLLYSTYLYLEQVYFRQREKFSVVTKRCRNQTPSCLCPMM